MTQSWADMTHLVEYPSCHSHTLWDSQPILVYNYVDEMVQLPCWPPKGQQMSHHRWIWRISCLQVMKHASERNHPALKPRAHATRKPKLGFGTKKHLCRPKNVRKYIVQQHMTKYINLCTLKCETFQHLTCSNLWLCFSYRTFGWSNRNMWLNGMTSQQTWPEVFLVIKKIY